MKTLNPPYSPQQQGASLLEVLVAIVVLSFGLLGTLGMLLNGLRITSTSHYRTIAAQQLTAMADTMNANPYIIASYSPPAGTTITANCLSTTGCTAAQLPQTEYGLWRERVTAALPNGSGTVCLDSTPADGNSGAWACDGSGRPTVKICWNESSRSTVSGGGTSGLDSSTDTCLSSQL